MEIAPYMAVFGLMMYKITMPRTVNTDAIVNAVFTDILPAGIGRFFVRSINASKSLSIIWLKAFEAPTIKYPPKANKTSVRKSTVCTPIKYPARDEKTTLTESLILVISLKSEIIEAVVTEEF